MDSIKMKASDLAAVRTALVSRQGGICPICKRTLRTAAVVNIVVDHDHNTGRVRAALHRGCNTVEGKVLNALSSWGGASTRPAQKKLLENLLEFWTLHETIQTEWIYHGHKTATEKRLALNKKRRRLAAKKREVK